MENKYTKQDIDEVVYNIVNMISNNMENAIDWLGESFEDWCENGGVFENEEVTDEQVESRTYLMNIVKDKVDDLTNLLLDLYNNV